MYWLFMYASKYIFSQTTAVKTSQNFLISLKKTEFTDLSTGWNSSGGSRISQRGDANPGRCANLLFCKLFCQKLHENERLWTGKGVGVPRARLDPPLNSYKKAFQYIQEKIKFDQSCSKFYWYFENTHGNPA